MLESLKAMPMKGKLTLAGSALGVVLVAFFLMQLATKPSYETLMSGVQPTQTAKITAALDSAGIAYELQNNGTAVAVQTGSTAQARVALATSGVDQSNSSQPGFEDLLSKQKLGTSDFQQKINYQRALEGEIAKTIDGVAGSGGARVQLSLPSDQLFASEEKPATASVLLGSGGDALEPAQIRGIASLVAGAVEGLKKDEVTITDGSGNLLWPTGEGDSAAGGSLTKTQAEARYAAQVQAQLTSLLEKTVGAGNAQVTVRPDLDMDRTSQEKLTYGKSTPLKQTRETETLAGTGAATGGNAGVTANTTNGTTTGAGGGNSNYRKSTTSTDNGVDKTVEKRQLATGAVNRMDVAVLVNSAAKPNVGAIQNALTSAAGIQTARGDTLSVQSVAFAKAPAAATPKSSPIPAGAANYAKYVALGLGVLLFLFFVTRAIRKREGAALGEPTWLTEISSPRPVAELEGGVATLPETSTKKSIEQLVDREPAAVAAQLRTWMAED
jgi:flagellar M-ring protein FliF